MAIETDTYVLPTHWASALINGDTSGLEPEDERHIEAFIAYMLDKHKQCWCIDVSEESEFTTWHDAREFGALAGDCSVFTFDITV